MPNQIRAACLGALTFAWGLSVAAQAPASSQEPPRIGGETIDVELKIVPFYAVDAEGRPVFDLRPDEIELRVGGVTASVASFDRYTAAGSWSGAQAAPSQSAARNVFLLFDTSFSTAKGLITGRQLASGLLERLPATDRLTLLVNDPSVGFKKPIGPVLADDQGKRKVMKEIQGIKPEVRRLNLNAVADMGPPTTGRTSKGQPAHQLNGVYDFTNGTSRGEYANFARELAESLEIFASDLRRIRGPKLLLVFSQGLTSRSTSRGTRGSRWAAPRPPGSTPAGRAPSSPSSSVPSRLSPNRAPCSSSSTPTRSMSKPTPPCATWPTAWEASTWKARRASRPNAASPTPPPPITKRVSSPPAPSWRRTGRTSRSSSAGRASSPGRPPR